MIIDTSGVGGVGGDWDWPKLAIILVALAEAIFMGKSRHLGRY